MKLSRLCLLVLMLYGLLVPCISSEGVTKTILVTYNDRILTRAPISTLAGSYRRSAAYNTGSTWSRNIAARLASEYQLTLETEWPISTLGVHCVVYKIPDDRSVDAVLESLGKNKLVESAQPMGSFNLHTANLNDSSDSSSDNEYPDDKSQTKLQALWLKDIHRISTGKGVSIALIDTGVDRHHPDLKGRIAFSHNLITERSKGFTGDLHGTAVAGVIAALADNNIGSVGIAPNARIVALKACWPHKEDVLEASCNSMSLAMAINRAIEMDVNIINLSLSGTPDPLVSRLINEAINRGITVVAADHQTNQVEGQSFPASMDAVIAALHLQINVDAKHTRNSRSIAVASTDILTTLPGSRYGLVSGCSIATAQVTGIVALLLEINPDLTPNKIQNLLETAHHHNSDGADEIDVHALILKLRHDHSG